MPESYTPEQRKPQLIWQGHHTIRKAELLPAQVVEVIRPSQEALTEVGGDPVQGRLSLLGQPERAGPGFGWQHCCRSGAKRGRGRRLSSEGQGRFAVAKHSRSHEIRANPVSVARVQPAL